MPIKPARQHRRQRVDDGGQAPDQSEPGFIHAAFNSGAWALVLVTLSALAAVITPALQGIMSKSVAADAQGELQGALSSLTALAMIPSPLVMTGTFAAFTASDATVYFPGAPFVLSAVLMVCALVVFMAKPRTRSFSEADGSK